MLCAKMRCNLYTVELVGVGMVEVDSVSADFVYPHTVFRSGTQLYLRLGSDSDKRKRRQAGIRKFYTTCKHPCMNNGSREQEFELTRGAKLTTFPHPFNLRSELTMPPIRVPNISRLLFSRTAALSSKRMKLPSGLRTGFRVRTITARRTSPRRTFTAFTDA